MSELIQTINESPADSSPAEGPGELIPTIDTAEEPLKTDEKAESQGEKSTEAKEPEAKESEERESEEKPDRLDKHPRFRQLIEANRELRKANVELMEKFDKAISQRATPQSSPKKGVSDVLASSDDELFEQLQENPKQFLANFAESIQQSTQEAMLSRFEDFQAEQQNRTVEQLAERNYSEFGEKHEDFWEMWDSGEIKSFMDKNPAHNAMSAYYALSADTRQQSVQQQIDEAVAKAVKETEERINKNIKAKRSVTYVPAGPRSDKAPGDSAPELNDSKQHGGMYNVLANRLQARRRQA